MDIEGMILIMNHLHLCLVLGHKYIDIAVQRIAMIFDADHLGYPAGFASHVVEMGQVVEIMKAGYTQHSPSSFPTRLTRS